MHSPGGKECLAPMLPPSPEVPRAGLGGEGRPLRSHPGRCPRPGDWRVYRAPLRPQQPPHQGLGLRAQTHRRKARRPQLAGEPPHPGPSQPGGTPAAPGPSCGRWPGAGAAPLGPFSPQCSRRSSLGTHISHICGHQRRTKDPENTHLRSSPGK